MSIDRCIEALENGVQMSYCFVQLLNAYKTMVNQVVYYLYEADNKYRDNEDRKRDRILSLQGYLSTINKIYLCLQKFVKVPIKRYTLDEFQERRFVNITQEDLSFYMKNKDVDKWNSLKRTV